MASASLVDVMALAKVRRTSEACARRAALEGKELLSLPSTSNVANPCTTDQCKEVLVRTDPLPPRVVTSCCKAAKARELEAWASGKRAWSTISERNMMRKTPGRSTAKRT